MYFTHRLVRLGTIEIWTYCFLLKPFCDTPFANMLQTLTATPTIKYNVVAESTNILQINWCYCIIHLEFYIEVVWVHFWEERSDHVIGLRGDLKILKYHYKINLNKMRYLN